MAKGYGLVHGARIEPRGQRIARLLEDGALQHRFSRDPRPPEDFEPLG